MLILFCHTLPLHHEDKGLPRPVCLLEWTKSSKNFPPATQYQRTKVTPLKQVFNILRNVQCFATSWEQLCFKRCAEEGGVSSNAVSSALEGMQLKSESQIASQCHILTQYIQMLWGFTNRKNKCTWSNTNLFCHITTASFQLRKRHHSKPVQKKAFGFGFGVFLQWILCCKQTKIGDWLDLWESNTGGPRAMYCTWKSLFLCFSFLLFFNCCQALYTAS